jgi:antibiotic biosynthesis monooxygenase (ABM) superfamily enzyme
MSDDKKQLGKAPEIVTPDHRVIEHRGKEVQEVVFSKILPGHHEDFRNWAVRMREAYKRAPGYRGSFLQPPDDPDGFWTTIVQFDKPASLETWMRSAERKRLLKDAKGFVEIEHISRVKSSFPGWFPTDPQTGNAPPNWKAALLVLLGLFPIVMLQLKFLDPVLRSWGLNASPATFLANAIGVTLTTFVTMPILVRLFDWWLFPKRRKGWIAALGVALLATLFVAEVVSLEWLIP